MYATELENMEKTNRDTVRERESERKKMMMDRLLWMAVGTCYANSCFSVYRKGATASMWLTWNMKKGTQFWTLHKRTQNNKFHFVIFHCPFMRARSLCTNGCYQKPALCSTQCSFLFYCSVYPAWGAGKYCFAKMNEKQSSKSRILTKQTKYWTQRSSEKFMLRSMQ